MRGTRDNNYVSFNPSAELVYIETSDEFTTEERESSYYQYHEYKQIKAANKALTNKLKAMKSGNLNSTMDCDDDENDQTEEMICFRGLEHKTEEATRRRRHSRFVASMAVFDEQLRQQTEGIVEETLISIAYKSETYNDQEVASEIGAKDAIEADLCWRGDEAGDRLHLITITRPAFYSIENTMPTEKNEKSSISKPVRSPTSSSTPPHKPMSLIERIVGARPNRRA